MKELDKFTRTKTSKIWTISIESLKNIVRDCSCFSDIMRKLGFRSLTGNSYKSLRNRLDRDGIDYTHIISRKAYHLRLKENVKLRYSDQEFFKSSSLFRSGVDLKKRILRNKWLEYQCSECGLKDEWNGKRISLHIDHINGVNTDNRLYNLRFLCPNCHSQTSTFSGKVVEKK